MSRAELYNSSKQWIYPAVLLKRIRLEITAFYDSYNSSNPTKKITKFNNEPAYYPLQEHIKLLSRNDSSEIPDPRWLQDFNNGKKDGKKLTITFFESLLSVFNYYYHADSDKFGKRSSGKTAEEIFGIERKRAIQFITEHSTKSRIDLLKDFFGVYKYFVGGRKESKRYDYIYENEIEIFKNGEFEVRNPFNSHTYTGVAMIKSNSSLQLTSFDFDGPFLEGVGNLLNFKINKYARKLKLIPGLSMSFDSDGLIMYAHALLSSELGYNKKSPIIREYFDKVVQSLRIYSPEIGDVEALMDRYVK